MARKRDRTQFSRDIGLEIGSICGRHFLKLRHLHYGYWPKELPVDITNLHAAQDHYARFLMAHIPPGARTILDVGCGTGELARDLKEAGYRVDCVSPNSFFAARTREILGPDSRVFECRYEQLQTSDRYDLVLFSESFQYIKLARVFEITLGFLEENGSILICDFFDRQIAAKSPLSGGCPWRKFTETVSQYPLELVEELDITDATAPTMDVLNDAFEQAVRPTVVLTAQLLENRYPWAYKLVTRLYRRRIDKLTRKYFSGEQTSENFKKYKSYKLLVYRKLAAGDNARVAAVEGVAPNNAGA